MKTKTAEKLIAVISGGMAFVMFMMFVDEAGATQPKTEQNQAQKSISAADANSESVSSATANNEGITLEGGDVNVGGDQVENNSSNVVLVPNNNTESCVRVFGIAFGKNGESGALGIPWRSKRCDFEQAADDAFAAGERELGWFWKCHNKSLFRQFDGVDDKARITACHDRMLEDTRDEVIADLQKAVEAAERRAKVADERSEFYKNHEGVCKESLERCQEKAYGGK